MSTIPTYLHINQQLIGQNKRLGNDHIAKVPVITVKRGRTNTYCHAVIVHGPSSLYYHPATPLSCGARATLQTSHTTPLTLLQRGDPEAIPLKHRVAGKSVVRIHVNKHFIRKNIKIAREGGALLPVFTVKVGRVTTPAQEVHFFSPVRILYCPEDPFDCADVWLELRGVIGTDYRIVTA